LGLGFNFGSQDKGLGESIKTTSTGLGQISSAVTDIGLASAAMIFKPPNFGPSISMATSLASDMKLTTTNIEAFGVASNKVTSAALAGLNEQQKGFKGAQRRLSSAAFAMNMDVGNITESFVALQQAQVDVKKVGFKSLKEYQKFIEVTGVDSKKFAGSLGRLTNQMGFSEEQAGDLVKATAAIGKKFNIGREAVQGMAETVQLLNDNSNKLPKNWGPQRTAQFVKGATAFAGALTSVGLTSDEAMKASQGLTTALLKGETGLADLYSGVKGTMPDVAKVMMENLGDAKSAFASLQDDPAAFMQNMGGLVDDVRGMNLDDKALNKFRTQMETTFGKDTMAMFTKQGMGKMGPALEEASKPIEGQAEILQTLASKYKDGRTAAERFAIAQDRLLTKMKGINGVMQDQEYLKRYKKNTNELAKQLESTVAEGGPLGKFTAKLIEARVHGVGGMLASQSKWGMAIAELSNQFAPILRVLPGIGAALLALTSPFAILAAAVAGLYFVFKDLDKGANSIIQPWLDRLKNELPKVMAFVDKFFTKALSVIGPAIQKVVDKIPWGAVVKLLGKGLAFAADLSLKMFDAALNIGGKILSALGEVDWGKVGGTLGVYLGNAMLIAMEYAAKIILNLPLIIYKAVKGAIGLLVGLVDGLVAAVEKKFPIIGGAIKFVILGAKAVLIAFAALVLYALVTLIPTFYTAGIAMAASMWAAIAPVLLVIGALAAVGVAVYALYEGFKYVWTEVIGGWDGLKDAIGLGDETKQATLDVDAMAKNHAIALDRAHKAAVASAAGQIGSVKDLAGVADAEVKGLVESQIASGERVVTNTGKIIASSEAISKWSKDAEGNLVRINVALSDMSLAIIDIPEWNKAVVAVDKVQSAIAKYGRGSKEATAATDEWVKSNKEFTKVQGYSMEQAANWNQTISEQLSIEDTLLDSVGEYNRAYATDLQDRINSAAQAIGEETKHIMGSHNLRLIAMKAAGKQETAAYRAELAARDAEMGLVNEKMKQFVGNIKNEAELVVGHIGATMESLGQKSKEGLALSARAAKLWANSTIKDASRTLAGVTSIKEKERKMIMAKIQNIADLQEQRVREESRSFKGSAAELDAHLKGVRKEYTDLSKEVTDLAIETQQNLALGLTEGYDKGLKAIEVRAAKAGIKINEGVTKGSDKIVKELGVSSKVAAGMVKTIAGINPKRFRKNVTAVSKAMKGFMKGFMADATKMMEGLATNINLVWETIEKGLADNEMLVSGWSGKASMHIQKYWQVSIGEAGKAVVAFLGFISKMQVRFKALAQSVNLMNLLASPSQIDLWASTVVSSLAVAMRGGKVADQMIGAAYNRAIASASIIESSVATPDGGGSGSGGGVGSAASASLIRSINEPTWTDPKSHIPTTLTDMNENIRKLAAALGATPEGAGSDLGSKGKTQPGRGSGP